jgi:chromate transporter
MDDGKLWGLVLLAVPLSLLSFGGGQTIVAGLNHQVVDVHQWLTGGQFADLFAISRAAPGPSTLIMALIGWQVGGLEGAIAGTLAIFIPSSALICLVGHLWQRHNGSAWTVAIERGLAPVAVGLVFAGAFAVARSADLTLVELTTIAGCSAVLYFTRIRIYTILGAVGLLYFGLALWQA